MAVCVRESPPAARDTQIDKENAGHVVSQHPVEPVGELFCEPGVRRRCLAMPFSTSPMATMLRYTSVGRTCSS
jgi:hypothetical protein